MFLGNYSFRWTFKESRIRSNASPILYFYWVYKRIARKHVHVSCFPKHDFIVEVNNHFLISRGTTYNLLRHNCNNFSEEVSQFLCGASIPKYILDLPNEVLQSGLSTILQTLVSRLEQSARPVSEEHLPTKNKKETSPDFEQLNSQIEEARSDDLNKTNGCNKKK